MFSDFKLLAIQHNPEIDEMTSIPYQAHKYYDLIKYAKYICSFIEYDMSQLFALLKADTFEKFGEACKRRSVNDELNHLINCQRPNTSYSYRSSNYRTSYTAREMYPDYEKKLDSSPYSDISNNLGAHLAEILNEISKKECFLNYKVNETEEDIVNAEYMDKVIICNDEINKIDSNWMYALSYEYTTEEDKVGFRKEVRGHSPIRYNPVINVNKNWFSSVFDHGIQILEYQGSRAYTLSAELIKTDSEKSFYYVDVLQMTGTRDEMQQANWHREQDKMDKIMKKKSLVLSLSTGGDNIWALGADEDWAYRTMKSRQKRHMYKQLTI